MGVGKIDVMSPGKTGVIIDVNPLEPGLPDDCLFAAQNAMHDPQMGEFGAIRKRLGQKQFNNASAVGAILGGIPMAVAGTGGAPALGGGGSTGTSTGTGNGTGSPGGTTEGSGVGNGSTTPGAGAYTGSSLFSGARLVAIGMDTNNANDGYGWYVGSKKMQDTPIVATSPGPPGAMQNAGYSHGNNGKPCVLSPDGWFYYSLATSESTTGNTVTIRRAGTLRSTPCASSAARSPTFTPSTKVVTITRSVHSPGTGRGKRISGSLRKLSAMRSMFRASRRKSSSSEIIMRTWW